MKVNIALMLNEEDNSALKNFYKTIKDNMNTKYGMTDNSQNHITIVKFEVDENYDINTLKKNLSILEQEYFVDFSGISILPSRSSKGCWVELSVLKSESLIELQRKVLGLIKDENILSGINDRFRPHITFCRTLDDNISFNQLRNPILRKSKVKMYLSIGYADDTFEFMKI